MTTNHKHLARKSHLQASIVASLASCYTNTNLRIVRGDQNSDPVAALFREGHGDSDALSLPFVRNLTREEKRHNSGRGRSYWSPGPLTPDYETRIAIGMMYAAAWLIYRRQPDTCVSLVWITECMPVENDGYKVGFLDHIEGYALGAARTWTDAELLAQAERRAHRSLMRAADYLDEQKAAVAQ